eukprot:COSAG03_NODE_23760_length_277_cov_0.696629_1_plen_86_part_01
MHRYGDLGAGRVIILFCPGGVTALLVTWANDAKMASMNAFRCLVTAAVTVTKVGMRTHATACLDISAKIAPCVCKRATVCTTCAMP